MEGLDNEIITAANDALVKKITDLTKQLADSQARVAELEFLGRDVVAHQPDCATDRHGGCADWCPVTKLDDALTNAGGK